MQKLPRLFEIDVLKALAIGAVILIHTTSTSFQFYPPNSKTWITLVSIDQILRFSVPLFVALSGYLLALKYLQNPLSLKEFFKRRVFRIFPPYLFWTLIIFLYLRLLTQEPNPHFPLWEIILLGKADYHLYFVPMIFQLYLLFPLILKAYKKSFQITLFSALAIQSAFYTITTLAGLNLIKFNFKFDDQLQYILPITWIFYFVLGIFLADSSLSKKVQKTTKFISLSFLLGGLILSIADTLSTFGLTQNLNIATRSTRFPVLIYATGAISTAFVYKDLLLKIPRHIFSTLKWFGQRSYSIYLLHTIVLRIAYERIHSNSPLKLAILTTSVIIISYTAAHITEDLGKYSKKVLSRGS